jgi:hypothetical protein
MDQLWQNVQQNVGAFAAPAAAAMPIVYESAANGLSSGYQTGKTYYDSLSPTAQRRLKYGAMGAGAVVLTPLVVLPLVGFGAGGVAAGSVAAGAQAGIGNVVAGSMFAGLQTLGAAGVATSTTVSLAAAGAAVGVGVAEGTDTGMKSKL